MTVFKEQPEIKIKQLFSFFWEIAACFKSGWELFLGVFNIIIRIIRILRIVLFQGGKYVE